MVAQDACSLCPDGAVAGGNIRFLWYVASSPTHLEQLQKKNMLSLHPELGIESFAAMIEPLRRGEQESIKYQTVQARGNGSTYSVEVNLQLITSDDGGEGFLAIINDITALRQADENIRAFNAPVERRASKRK